jgi:cytochrome c2
VLGVDPGELLVGELNCLACHEAPESVHQRVASRGAPKLGAEGLRLTPQWLRAWLADPAASKSGTSMPHALAGLGGAQRAEAVEALAQYLVSVQPQGASVGVSADASRAEKGRVLYHTVGCVACHEPFDRGDATAESWERARANAVPMGDLARKYPAGELARLLRDPVAHRPGGRMPSLGLTESESLDLATYLLREQLTAAAQARVEPVAGLKWEYFEGNFNRCADLANQTPVATGVTDSINARPAKRENNFGLRFSGLIEVPADGEYEFWSTSDDGSQIWVNGRTVVNNDGEHGTTTRAGKVMLTRGAHPFEVLFFQSGGGFEFAVAWAGPGFQRTSIPGSVFRHEARPLLPLGKVDFPYDPAKVAAGREWFERLNCAACHEGTGIVPRKARPWLELASSGRKGCLADDVPAAAVRYDLTPDQRQALRSMVAEAGRLATAAPVAVAAATELSRLNCYACHSRDGVGGPGVSGHEPWFKLVGEADLGEEGRIPPLLTGVGGKLRSDWLKEILLHGTKVRPYMATRMPLFGKTNAGRLHAALRTADRSPNAAPEPSFTERDAKFGWKLAGRDGLSCIACHTFSTYGSMGIPALGLDTMHRRLEWDWFRRYLPDPAALRPGTRMPTFWPDGHAVNRDILGGDTGAQIQALWAYLAGGAKAEVPAGLIRGRMELVADKEPLIYRNFIEGAGARAIGVGYPQHANLAFDAEHSRLALLWQGSFIDAARHSTDRGVGFEPPLGDHRVAFPAGPALAVLPAADSAWPSTGNVRFRGYRFNAERQPLFEYSVGLVRVTDTFVPRPGEVDMSMVRTLQFSGTTSDRLWFRAASGTIRREADGSFVVDDKLKIRLRGGGEPVLVGQELRVPVMVPGELVEEFTW